MVSRALLMISGILITSLVLPNVFADSYQDFPIRLKHSPTICAMEPQPDPQFPGLGKDMLDKTNQAVMDWNNQLNEGYGKHPPWNITLVEVPLSKQPNFDSANCDITMTYFRHPSDSQLEFVATGMTIPNFDEGKTRIEIYYMGIKVLAQYVQWTTGGITYYEYIPHPTYTGFLAGDPQLDGAIRHEIGHSLGLGHYIVSNDELQRIIHGGEDMPSIMVPIETAAGVTHFSITQLDIAELKSIYGYNGIGSQVPINNYNRLSVIQTDKTVYSPGDMIKIKVDTSNFDDNEYANLMALDPENKLIDIFAPSKTNSTFYLSNENETGQYYIEFLDPYKDMYDFASFTVSNSTLPSFDTPVGSQDAQISPDHAPAQNLIAGVSIPAWIKNNAKWWSEGQLGDYDFVKGIQYMIQHGIMKIPQTQSGTGNTQQIPAWVKKNAGWWADGQISDDEFVKGIQFLVSTGIITTK